jgi:glyoxylase I family protein
MERVTGVGGIFFRAQDPAALSRWYHDHLGVTPPPSTYEEPVWWQQAGPTVFAAMDRDSPHFGRAEQRWSINFRVNDLDAMIAQLSAAGIAVGAAETHPNGRFAELADPEGNPIQLWEPDTAEFHRSRPD